MLLFWPKVHRFIFFKVLVFIEEVVVAAVVENLLHFCC